MGFAPIPGFVVTPLAQREQHRPAGLAQCFAHGQVRAFGLESLGVAPVVLEIVDAPLRIGLRVLEFVAAAAGPAAAGLPARIRIDAQLQALRVHVVGQRFHAGGKVLGVRVDETFRVAFAVPAVVDVHVQVAGVFHAARDHGIGGLADHLFVDVAGELFQLFQPICGVFARPSNFCACAAPVPSAISSARVMTVFILNSPNRVNSERREFYQPNVLRSAVMGSSQGSYSPFNAWTAVWAMPMPSSR